MGVTLFQKVFSGEDATRVGFPSAVGRPRHQGAMVGIESWYGSKTRRWRGNWAGNRIACSRGPQPSAAHQDKVCVCVQIVFKMADLPGF